MIGAGTVINPIIKIVTAVAILAAVGIFVVRPILDTTEKAIDSVNAQVRDGIEQGQQASQDAQLNSSRSRAESYASSLQSQWPAARREVRSCVADAGDSPQAMERCADLGQRLVHVVQSDRTFSLSYADSLEAQGNGADADRVRECVKQAGFQAAAMNRCQKLADELLFG